MINELHDMEIQVLIIPVSCVIYSDDFCIFQKDIDQGCRMSLAKDTRPLVHDGILIRQAL